MRQPLVTIVGIATTANVSTMVNKARLKYARSGRATFNPRDSTILKRSAENTSLGEGLTNNTAALIRTTKPFLI